MYGLGKFLVSHKRIAIQVPWECAQTDPPWSISQSTQPFELYLTVSPSMPKNAVVSAANAIARWINKEEAKLFLRDAPVF